MERGRRCLTSPSVTRLSVGGPKDCSPASIRMSPSWRWPAHDPLIDRRCLRVVKTRWPDSRTVFWKPGLKNGARRREFYEDRNARISILARGLDPRPDTLKQTDRSALSIKSLADGAGHTFFKAELLGVNKVPHRSIVDLEAALAKFSHQTAQGELSVPDPLREKDMVLAGNGFGFVAAHLAWRHAARRLEPPNPIHHRAAS